jgi:hypothetical protein
LPFKYCGQRLFAPCSEAFHGTRAYIQDFPDLRIRQPFDVPQQNALALAVRQVGKCSLKRISACQLLNAGVRTRRVVRKFRTVIDRNVSAPS